MASKLFVKPSAYPCKSALARFYLLNVTNEVGEKCFHLLVSFSIEHARVLVESIVLGTVPVDEEFSIKELSVVESLTEGGGLLLHGGKG